MLYEVITVYFGLSGSDANETNIKLVWYYNNILGRLEKKKIISRWRGYHGSGLMTGSLTGLELFHKKFDLPLAQVIHTEAPYYFRRPDPAMSETEFSAWCAAELETLIEREGRITSYNVCYTKLLRDFAWSGSYSRCGISSGQYGWAGE